MTAEVIQFVPGLKPASRCETCGAQLSEYNDGHSFGCLPCAQVKEAALSPARGYYTQRAAPDGDCA